MLDFLLYASRGALEIYYCLRAQITISLSNLRWCKRVWNFDMTFGTARSKLIKKKNTLTREFFHLTPWLGLPWLWPVQGLLPSADAPPRWQPWCETFACCRWKWRRCTSPPCGWWRRADWWCPDMCAPSPPGSCRPKEATRGQWHLMHSPHAKILTRQIKTNNECSVTLQPHSTFAFLFVECRRRMKLRGEKD